ncbi:BnaC07g34430D [Brassica napus]|uniref:(rape) hypothetical protein n=1 Tax=Brassica napus TaxID=3708 RepID=A0A078FC85_BRANA|nr:unnamed protein product [Brassica napus]CDY09618.1 BnaC07g34430D [Brassica napus]
MIPTSTTLVSSMTTTTRKRRLNLDVDSSRAMSEWSLGFEITDNGVSVGRRNDDCSLEKKPQGFSPLQK